MPEGDGEDMLIVGREAYEQKDYYLAKRWLELSVVGLLAASHTPFLHTTGSFILHSLIIASCSSSPFRIFSLGFPQLYRSDDRARRLLY